MVTTVAPEIGLDQRGKGSADQVDPLAKQAFVTLTDSELKFLTQAEFDATIPEEGWFLADIHAMYDRQDRERARKSKSRYGERSTTEDIITEETTEADPNTDDKLKRFSFGLGKWAVCLLVQVWCQDSFDEPRQLKRVVKHFIQNSGMIHLN